MEIAEKFKRKYGETLILSKCRENRCSLKDIKQDEYLIIDGDHFKHDSDEKSVDCILIDLNPNSEGKYRIVLCELTFGKKLLADCKDKFKSSGKLIIKVMNDFDESIYKIDCLLLGKIKQNGKCMAQKALISLKIEGYPRPANIQPKPCGFSISELNN